MVLDIKKLILKLISVEEYSHTAFTYNSGWTFYSAAGAHEPRGIKQGRIVVLSGLYKATSDKSGTGTMVVGKVPDALKPKYEHSNIISRCYMSGLKGDFRLIIDTSGNIMMDIYSRRDQNATVIKNGDWFAINVTYVSAE